MTICIAGIAENIKVAAITDKMLTIASPTATKYEISENHKAIELTEKVIGMFAGDVILSNSILTAAMKKIDAESPKTVEEIAQKVAEAYKERWIKILEDHFFGRFNLTVDVFVANQAKFDADLVKQGNNLLRDHNLDVQIIVAGVDESGPHVFSIGSPGAVTANNSVGYGCIGSGAQHAILSLIESSYHLDISEEAALHALIEAKRRAQFDPGVGELCDIVLVDGSLSSVSEEIISEIMEEYKKSTDKIKQIESECSAAMHKRIHVE